MLRTSLSRPSLVALVGACIAICAMAVGSSAEARTITPYEYVDSFDGTGPNTAGAFSEQLQKVAVNEETGRVYVTDGGYGGILAQFDADGNPVPFSDPSAGGKNFLVVQTGEGGSHVAVDNTGGASQGNIYVHQGSYQGNMLGFDETGKPLPGNWPICATPCGKGTYWSSPGAIAVDPLSTLWIASSVPITCESHNCVTSWLSPFNVNGDPVASGTAHVNLNDPIPSPSAYGLGIDSDGNFYVSNRNVLKYDPEGNLLDEQFEEGSGSSGSAQSPTEITVDRSNDRVLVDAVRKSGVFGEEWMSVAVLEPNGELIDTFGEEEGAYPGIEEVTGVAVNASNHRAYVTNGLTKTVDIFDPGPAVVVPDVKTVSIEPTSSTAKLTGTVDPDGGGAVTSCYFSWRGTQPGTKDTAPCDQAVSAGGGEQTVTATISGLAKGQRYFVRLFSVNGAEEPQAGRTLGFRAADLPVLSDIAIRDVNTNTAKATATINPEGGAVTYRVDYGTTTSYGSSTALIPLYPILHNNTDTITPRSIAPALLGLTPDTTYHFRITVTNDAGTVVGPDREFHTFPFIAVLDDSRCPNALVRQQTGSALLLDCRAYELVSARYAGGYDVESDLIPGQDPFPGFPDVDGKALYAVHSGVVPGAGNPTNRGRDPYLATRGDDAWRTSYVGIPANETPSLEPFASTLAAADSLLSTFAFAGPDICDPCFDDGRAGIPVRLPGGSLVQGMVGSLPVSDPEPAGAIAKPLSDDGTHLVFGSEEKFEPDGNSGELSIYDRNLTTGVTKVVSKTPLGSTMTGPAAADSQLDISDDGSRILLGDTMRVDTEGNAYFHLYMNVGASTETIDVTPTTTTGVRYAGMSADGSRVLFTTKDPMASDGDASADLFVADVTASGADLSQVSTGDSDACTPTENWNTPEGGPNCDVLAVAGGGGVASGDGTVYFFSPEQLAGPSHGTAGEPNLYAARPGQAPTFIETVETGNPAVAHGISDAGRRETADFQVNRSGDRAVFVSTLPLTGFENVGYTEIFMADSDVEGEVTCVSCTPSNAPGAGDSSLASNGLSLIDDGRVFFTSSDALALRDANNHRDVYEWTPADGGTVELISTGGDPDDSSLLSATANGKDVFFFTHQTLVRTDENGPLIKLYDAREGGGFFIVPPRPACAASDECHGPSSVPGPPPNIRTIAGTDGNGKQIKRCKKKGFVKKRGKCVKKKKKHPRHSTRRHG